ncbi:MAG: hypothetical protein JF617_18305, partial [Burkholderiales bacterium]|nr:hypothetical protein [Burkholderiales bacterium]
HDSSRALADFLYQNQWEILAPVLHLWEVHAYQRHPNKAKSHRTDSDAKLKITTVDVTTGLFLRTYSDAMVHVRGADRVFVSLAKDERAPLVTNDKQMLQNAAHLGVRALSVEAFLRVHCRLS